MGPNLLDKIYGVLLRFLTNEIALTADIKQAFLNIEMDESSWDYLKFTWFKDINDINKEDVELLIYRFIWLVFSLKGSFFLLDGTIQYYLNSIRNTDSPLFWHFLQDLCIDDCISGAKSIGKYFYRNKSSYEIWRTFCDCPHFSL